jgi:ABC-type uncharacterized transport system involved in gliding motility auxiliary subunit
MSGMPALLGALGLVALVFGFLNLIVGLIGAGIDPLWVYGNLIAGVVLLLVAGVRSVESLRERLGTGEARRAGRFGSSAVLSTVFALAILWLLGFLATRYPVRFDWTEQKVHSLSDQTQKVLAGLDADVQVLALYPAVDAAPVRELLDRYAYASPRFHVEFADPSQRPDLIEKFQIPEDQLGRGLVRVALGEESTQLTDVTEETLTNAMVKLTRTGQKTVYFLEGHNERATTGEASSAKEGYGRAAQALANERYQTKPLLLASTGEVPSDADVVIVAGATRPLLGDEHAALNRYLSRGGSLLVMLDPRAKTDLVDDLHGWGVEVGDDIIVDRKLALFGRATSPFAGNYDTGHPITKDLRETTLFHVARSVRPAGEANPAIKPLVFTGEDSWAERDLDRFFGEAVAELGPDDLKGPVSVAVAGELDLSGDGAAAEAAKPDAAKPADEAKAPDVSAAEPANKRARITVFGDSDFASNELIEAYRNRDLFLNSVNWLLGDVEAISIRPNQSRASRFQLTQEQFTAIRSLSLFVLPEAFGVLGVLTWWSRRRPPEHG